MEGNEGDELLFLTLRSSSIINEEIHSIADLTADQLVNTVIHILISITGEIELEDLLNSGYAKKIF